ncbi:MAG: S-layer homology domain-containing protein, partial [Clostridia bacterium]|nr:S-layer homology domain-containing protein [Clostridia bacterium]
MKRIFSLILCLLMLIGAVPAMAVSADEPAKSFADVKEGKWYYEGVMWCAEQGYMAGESETLFAPSKEMTRSMLVTVLAAIAGVDTNADEYKHSEFVDVKDGKWYTGAVVWANANNIAN